MENTSQNSTTLPGTRDNIFADPGLEPSSGLTRRIPGPSEVKKQDKQIPCSQRKKLKIRISTWNIGSMTGKSKEIADVMRRRHIDIACVQETKWQNTNENKSRYLETDCQDYKLYYYGKTNKRNGVGVIIEKKYQENVVKITGVTDRILIVKIVILDKIYNIVSAYAPQVGCSEDETSRARPSGNFSAHSLFDHG
ncbi:hypothetical protein M8J77_011855 [Diaphorina citri]|nr:hypothetical protein M8J77_011855 [Diaphorina citri]